MGFGSAGAAVNPSLLAPTPLLGTGSSTVSSLGLVPVLGSERDLVAQSKQAQAKLQQQRAEQDLLARNRPLSDADLDAMFPPEGYRIAVPPDDYHPVRSSRALLAAPGEGAGESDAAASASGATRAEFSIQSGPGGLGARTNAALAAESGRAADGDLPFVKPEDMEFFGRLVEDVDRRKEAAAEDTGGGGGVGDGQAGKKRKRTQSPEEERDLAIMKLLLNIKNGLPRERKVAMRQITDRAPEFGPAALFNQVLPILMSPSLEDKERHLLVKVIDRVLFKLEDRVRPFCHKILMVIVPMLVDEDNYARVEGREIVASLAKAAGLATMIQTMKDDLSNVDDYVRNVTARAFAVVASALGIPALLPFLDAVCRSRKSWEARHTGIKIVPQIAVLMGSAVRPHLSPMVDMIEHGLNDQNPKVSMITAQAVAALARASHPYGIECFGGVLKPLFEGVRVLSNKRLSAYLKAVGFVIPLMDHDSADAFSSGACTRLIMPILIREFSSPDDDMKRVVLNVLTQCVKTEGVEAAYVRDDVLPEFFKRFWVRRMALDRRNYSALVDTTASLADKVGASQSIAQLVPHLMDESEPFRKMVVECVDKVLSNLGAAEVDARLAERLVDGILYAFQEDNAVLDGGGKQAAIVLNGFGTVVNALGPRVKPYLAKICGTIKWRLHNKSAAVRMQAADLASRIALVVMQCGEEDLLNHLGVILFEYLGEEYPEVLGSILGALRSIVNVVGMEDITPPIRDLLPRLTPVLKNRHEKVQENCIDLIGRIADRAAAQVSAREWMRICFELLELLKAPRKSIRRAAVSTFGFIAKAIGPQDVLHTLLNNLKVQDRQNRVCTTVAIAIVAETCSPFTVLPALMNEYRVPDLNVQNGVLKALSFLFEYIGPMAKDYIYAITPLITNALQDRDLVHRQTASAVTKHIALGVQGLGCEDAVLHLLNHVWPNIFEQSPHVIKAVLGAIEGCRVSLGVHVILSYVLQGLFHPARRVRDVYWRIYNNLYVYGADQLTPVYPDLPDDGVGQSYRRTHLDLFV
jgi:splicing factor 3B subunit 1